MNPIRVLIVDDERLARDRIRRMLKSDPDVEILSECSNGEQALSSIQTQIPDILFLDIHMPEMDGFQVLESLLREKQPYIIFVTAFDQRAVRIFESHRLDYLLKPFNEERFRNALRRAKEGMRKHATNAVGFDAIRAALTELRLAREPIKSSLKENTHTV